jgi:hydrogenase/urease accessory protein HupE
MKNIFLFLVVLCFSGSLHSHENRPLYVDVTEVAVNEYQVRLKVPPTVAANNQPKLIMPQTCTAVSLLQYRCEQDIADQTISVAFTLYNPSVSTFMRLTRMNGEIYSDLLTAEETTWTVPKAETASGVAKHYTWLGVEHILIGIDHLLFLGCLLFIAKTFRRVVLTVTGFTLAHSLTLVASALEWVSVPVAPVETLIAFSILFLATEIVRNNHNTLTQRFPIMVSSSFGLLHGFGFASVLQEIGLPQTEVITGLLFFNIGVEIGQLMFIFTCFLIVFVLLKPLSQHIKLYEFSRTTAVYGIGILSSYWMFERGASVFSG